MNLRWKPWTLRGGILGIALVVVVFLAACSSSAGSRPASATTSASSVPAYCQKLIALPPGLETAVRDAAAKVATANQQATIAKAADQLTAAAATPGVPADVSSVLKQAAATLRTLSQGGSVSDADVQNFLKLGGTVASCVHQ